MSYIFDGNDEIYGNSGGTKGYMGDATGFVFPITLACYCKYANHPATGTDEYIFALTKDNTTTNGLAVVQLRSTADNFTARIVGSDTNTNAAIRTATDGTYDNLWVPLVGVFAGAGTSNNTSRTIRVAAYANSAVESTARDTTNLKYLFCGEAPSGGGDLGTAGAPVKVAELAAWRIALSQAEIEAFMAGTSADQIAASDLLCYYSLAADTAQDSGIVSIGALGISGAVYSSDHPTISHPSVGVATRMALLGVG